MLDLGDRTIGILKPTDVEPILITAVKDRPKAIIQHKYSGAITLAGNKMDDIQVAACALDTLKEKSHVAKRLIENVDKWNGLLGKDVAIFRGPVFVKIEGCSCPACSSRNGVFPRKLCTSFNSEGNYIVFNESECVMYDGSEPWMTVPPELIIGHELVHAYHHACGTMLGTGSREEEQTVGLGIFADLKFTENSIRKDYGLPLRPRY